MQVLHCWNHLKRDFKDKLRQLGADQSELGIYMSNWRQMAQAESEDQFHEIYAKLIEKWSLRASKNTSIDL